MPNKPENSELANRSSGSLLETALSNLPKEQRDKLTQKAIEEKLNLEVEEIKANSRHARSTADMRNTVKHVQEIESSTKSDFTVNANFETASGHTKVEIKKSNNTTIIVIAVVVAVLFLIFFNN